MLVQYVHNFEFKKIQLLDLWQQKSPKYQLLYQLLLVVCCILAWFVHPLIVIINRFRPTSSSISSVIFNLHFLCFITSICLVIILLLVSCFNDYSNLTLLPALSII